MTKSENATEQVDVEALRAALKAANDEAASFRHKNKELSEQVDTLTEASGKYKSNYIASKVTSALNAHGATNAKISRVLDLSKIDVDDAGELVGFEEQLPPLRDEFPEFFDARRRAPSIDAGDKKPAKKALSSAEKLLAQAR